MMREDRVVGRPGRVSKSKSKLGPRAAMRGRLADDHSTGTSVRGNIKVCARLKLYKCHEKRKRKERGKEGEEEGEEEEEEP